MLVCYLKMQDILLVHFLLFKNVFFWFSSADWNILKIRAEQRRLFLLLSIHTVAVLGCALVKHLGRQRDGFSLM